MWINYTIFDFHLQFFLIFLAKKRCKRIQVNTWKKVLVMSKKHHLDQGSARKLTNKRFLLDFSCSVCFSNSWKRLRIWSICNCISTFQHRNLFFNVFFLNEWKRGWCQKKNGLKTWFERCSQKILIIWIREFFIFWSFFEKSICEGFNLFVRPKDLMISQQMIQRKWIINFFIFWLIAFYIGNSEIFVVTTWKKELDSLVLIWKFYQQQQTLSFQQEV